MCSWTMRSAIARPHRGTHTCAMLASSTHIQLERLNDSSRPLNIHWATHCPPSPICSQSLEYRALERAPSPLPIPRASCGTSGLCGSWCACFALPRLLSVHSPSTASAPATASTCTHMDPRPRAFLFCMHRRCTQPASALVHTCLLIPACSHEASMLCGWGSKLQRPLYASTSLPASGRLQVQHVRVKACLWHELDCV